VARYRNHSPAIVWTCFALIAFPAFLVSYWMIWSYLYYALNWGLAAFPGPLMLDGVMAGSTFILTSARTRLSADPAAARRRAEKRVDQGKSKQQVAEGATAAGRAPKIERPGRPDKAPEPPPISNGNGAARRGPAPHPQRDLAVKRVIEGGEDAARVARELHLEPRTVQIWVKKAREQGSATSRSVRGRAHEIARVQEPAPDAPVPKASAAVEDQLH
jgi:transposase